MSEFKGTSGPWDYDSALGAIFNKSCLFICDVSEKENARLIAAAPELLEALQEMVEIVKKNSYPQPDKPGSNYARAEAAQTVIAKALGK